MEKLFQEFEATALDQWLKQITADLKGKPIDQLNFKPEFDLQFRSYYHRSEAPEGHFSTGKQANSWKNRRFFENPSNKVILKNLNEGIDCLGLTYTDQNSFETQTKDVQFEFIDADLKFSNTEAATTFKGVTSIRLNFDVIGLGLKAGNWDYDLNDFHSFYEAQKDHQCIWVSGSIYGEAGASCTQELALTANHANEYIQLLTDKGVSLEEINRNLVIELSVTEDYFVNIAKFKLIRYMIGLVFSAYNPNYQLKPFTVYAKTSRRFMARNDHNNNLLRQTTMAMSAIIGGCDVITVQSIASDELQQRMAKNIPLILKEESYLDKVADASEGSYYMEMLCNELLEKAWQLFKEVEKMGGFIAAAGKNYIQEQISINQKAMLNAVNEGKKTFLGVNKYPSGLEEWIDVSVKTEDTKSTFTPLNTYQIEPGFKKELHEQS